MGGCRGEIRGTHGKRSHAGYIVREMGELNHITLNGSEEEEERRDMRSVVVLINILL
jgi:hypothetical protein